MKTRMGYGLAEAAVAVGLGTMLVLVAFDALIWSRRSEERIGLKADLCGQAALARSWLARDLDRLDGKLEVSAQELTIAVGSGAVRYRFDPATGDLTRRAAGEPDRAFRLGRDAAVVWVKVDPSFANGSAELGRYNNRLVYRLTAAATHAAGAQSVTLVGSSPFLVKASRDTFPYWNAGGFAE